MGLARVVSGSLQAQLNPLAIAQGEFRVPIASMSTGSSTRDCHMREALGIDYAHSRFPTDHVCVNDQLPSSGPDAAAFPEIVIRIRGLRQAEGARGPVGLTPMQPLDAEIRLGLSIHGRDNDLSAPVRMQLLKPDLVQVDTEFDVRLSDFGVVVIMPRLLSVADRARVKLALLLSYRPGSGRA